jgi:hypothetical protein
MKYLFKSGKLLLLVFGMVFITACSRQHIDDYNTTLPDFDVIDFFTGDLEANGVVINYSGQVTRRFTVKMLGTVDNKLLTLDEWFVFDDGEKLKRTWRINQNSDGTYNGTAGDIIGTAQGEQLGMALHWDYEMELSVDDSVYRVVFDDWLYRVDNNNIINRSVIKKLGFKVGEVILSIRKI